MRGRREEHLHTYLDQYKDTNFCNIFSSVSTGIDSWLYLSSYFCQICNCVQQKKKTIAGSGCFKINRNAGLTSPEKSNSAHIRNKMVYVCFLRVQLESMCRCGEYTHHCSFSGCIFLEEKFIQDKLDLGGKQEITENSGSILPDTYNTKGVDVCRDGCKCYEVKKVLETRTLSGFTYTKSIVPLVQRQVFLFFFSHSKKQTKCRQEKFQISPSFMVKSNNQPKGQLPFLRSLRDSLHWFTKVHNHGEPDSGADVVYGNSERAKPLIKCLRRRCSGGKQGREGGSRHLV